MIPYPNIDPIAFTIPLGFADLAVRWYSLAYMIGIIGGWYYIEKLNRKEPVIFTKKSLDDLVLWAVLGIILGGRLGYVIFYKPLYFLQNPGEILALWEGGMSFHGGFLGVIIAMYFFARKHKTPYFGVTDLMAVATPIGLGLGRIANFINGELYGRVSDVPWAMIFPHSGDGLPRHPSQLYQAGMEGILLFIILYIAAVHTKARNHIGMISGLFLIFYALFRIIGELFREPDAHLGFLAFGITMGQVLSLPMMALGIYLIWGSKKYLFNGNKK